MIKFYAGHSYIEPGLIAILKVAPRQDLMTKQDEGKMIFSLLHAEVRVPSPLTHGWIRRFFAVKFAVWSDAGEILRRQPAE